MIARQLSVFVENRMGSLYEIAEALADNGVDIRAITLADTVEFGILRLIVSDPDRAMEILKAKSFAVSITEVIAVKVSDRPGGLKEVLGILREANISVEYVYAFVSKSVDASVILHVQDNRRALEVLAEHGVPLMDEVY
ncbi:MAG TPA: ACT domain-containing protein [Candidatus Pullichristensenella excrementigallinarum]|uniref:ACT domain-containing protein n=1 Tax=Candidatus Pullichristensenella excrementigallinarum TaxID=2840907 RepID=A0A9D1IC10_9FIRM|nr:ACT domain-containing protein [Candidatus Pullichristensenella excrementigallinarum]